MAMKVRYTTVNGRIISQNKGGVYTRLLSDPLGNVIATVDASGVKTNDTTYWPYGEVRTGGVSTVTNLGFCGAWGYYTDASARLYVRARYYRPVLGRWQTKDPLWPSEHGYAYSDDSPLTFIDYSGLSVTCRQWMVKLVATCQFRKLRVTPIRWHHKKLVWCSGDQPCDYCKCPKVICTIGVEASGFAKGFNEDITFKFSEWDIKDDTCKGLNFLKSWVKDIGDKVLLSDILRFIEFELKLGKTGFYTDCKLELNAWMTELSAESCKFVSNNPCDPKALPFGSFNSFFGSGPGGGGGGFGGGGGGSWGTGSQK